MRHLIEEEKSFSYQKKKKKGLIGYLGGIKMGITHFSLTHISYITNMGLFGYNSYFTIPIKFRPNPTHPACLPSLIKIKCTNLVSKPNSGFDHHLVSKPKINLIPVNFVCLNLTVINMSTRSILKGPKRSNHPT